MEYWDLFDRDNHPTGETHRRGEPIPKGRYHRVVEAWIRTPDGHFIIQKRARNKKSYPGYWSCTAVGSVLAGESPEEGMIREMGEEMGIQLDLSDLELDRIITDFPAHYYVYRIEKDVTRDEIILQKSEVEEVAFLTAEELRVWGDDKKMINLDYYRDFFEKWK